MKKIMVFGTFDILHPGHLDLFRQAKELGDHLIVVVAHDETVKSVKGKYPVNKQTVRIAEIKKQAIIDEVIAGGQGNKLQVIKDLKPQVICLGYDQQAFVTELLVWIDKNIMDIEIKRAQPYKSGVYKSSKLRTGRDK